MKRVLTVFLVLLFAALVSAEDSTTYYCDQFPSMPDCVCRQVTVFDDFGNPKVWSEVEEVLPGSSWFNMYCTGDSLMMQQRVGFQIVKPVCVERQEIRQHQEAFEGFCAKCPEPDLVGEWRVRECVGTKTLYQRDIVAYYFLPDVDECEQGNWMMLRLEEAGPCSDSGTIVIPIGDGFPPLEEPGVVFAPTAIVVSVLVLVVLAVAVVFVWRYKRKRR